MKILKGLLINNSEKVKVIYMDLLKGLFNRNNEKARAYGSTMGLESVYVANGKEFIGKFKGISKFKGEDKYEYSIEGGIILLDEPAKFIKLANRAKRATEFMYVSKKQSNINKNAISSAKI